MGVTGRLLVIDSLGPLCTEEAHHKVLGWKGKQAEGHYSTTEAIRGHSCWAGPNHHNPATLASPPHCSLAYPHTNNNNIAQFLDNKAPVVTLASATYCTASQVASRVNRRAVTTCRPRSLRPLAGAWGTLPGGSQETHMDPLHG